MGGGGGVYILHLGGQGELRSQMLVLSLSN